MVITKSDTGHNNGKTKVTSLKKFKTTSTPSSEDVAPQSPSLITTCALKTGGNPKNISVMFGDSNDV